MVFDVTIIDYQHGYVSLRIEGENSKKIFENESGTHQWHRIPPTENRGRVHTSVVKVAVLEIQPLNLIKIDDRDIEITTTRGSGPGGQHRNKVETAIILKHKPSGLVIRCETERSQYQNKILAYEILQSKLKYSQQKEYKNNIDLQRKEQMGTGQRAEKIRTYTLKHNIAIDHRTGKKFSLKDWLSGKWNF